MNQTMPYTDKKKAETIDGPTLAALRQPVSYETLGAVIMALEHQYYLREVSVRPSVDGAYLEVYDADWERLVEPENELQPKEENRICGTLEELTLDVQCGNGPNLGNRRATLIVHD